MITNASPPVDIELSWKHAGTKLVWKQGLRKKGLSGQREQKYTACSNPSEMQTLYAQLKAANHPAFKAVNAKDDFLWDLKRGRVAAAVAFNLTPPPVPATQLQRSKKPPASPLMPLQAKECLATFPIFSSPQRNAPPISPPGTTAATHGAAHGNQGAEDIESYTETDESSSLHLDVTERGAKEDEDEAPCGSGDSDDGLSAPLTARNLAQLSGPPSTASSPISLMWKPSAIASPDAATVLQREAPPRQAHPSRALLSPQAMAAAEGGRGSAELQLSWDKAFPALAASRAAGSAAKKAAQAREVARPTLALAYDYDARWLLGGGGVQGSSSSGLGSKRPFSFVDMLYRSGKEGGVEGRRKGRKISTTARA